jgi:hypothetical protein
MKKNYFLIIFLILITTVLIGAASTTIFNSNIITQKTVQTSLSANSVTNPIKIVSSTSKKYLIDSGTHKFYWAERGGIFSYNWKTYRTSTGSVVIYVNYKTTTNSWKGTYTIKKAPKNKLKIISTSPEIKLYSGHLSIISYVNNPLTPVKYYFKVVKKQIKSDGYFFI